MWGLFGGACVSKEIGREAVLVDSVLKPSIQIRYSKSEDSCSGIVEKLSSLINRVYDDAEAGMWKFKSSRVNEEELQSILLSKSLILALIEDKIIGCVQISEFDSHSGHFGMLVTDFTYRGFGIGSGLVKAAEDWARDKGYSQMTFGLLTPKHWSQPHKEYLKRWYTRLGYTPQKGQPFHRCEELATECDYTLWAKPL